MFNNRWKDRGWRWRRNAARGESFIFETWVKRTMLKRDGSTFTLYEGWERQGTLYRAHKGDRWVYQIERRQFNGGKTYSSNNLRETMRLGLFLTLLEKRNA